MGEASLVQLLDISHAIGPDPIRCRRVAVTLR
jgi:hypothetical protein